jgi:hypothetical protein
VEARWENALECCAIAGAQGRRKSFEPVLLEEVHVVFDLPDVLAPSFADQFRLGRFSYWSSSTVPTSTCGGQEQAHAKEGGKVWHEDS